MILTTTFVSSFRRSCLDDQTNLDTVTIWILNTWIPDSMGVWYSKGKVTWLGEAFKYRTFWTINRLFSVRFSDHYSNTRLFDNRTQIYHLNTRLVRYSDVYSTHCLAIFLAIFGNFLERDRLRPASIAVQKPRALYWVFCWRTFPASIQLHFGKRYHKKHKFYGCPLRWLKYGNGSYIVSSIHRVLYVFLVSNNIFFGWWVQSYVHRHLLEIDCSANWSLPNWKTKNII